MKKSVALILCVVLCMSVSVFAEDAANFFDNKIILSADNESAVLNGEKTPLEANGGIAPKIVDGNLMIPLRFVAENLGATVFFEEESKSIFVMKGDLGIIVQSGNPKIFYTEGDYELPVATYIENSRTFVCADAFLKELGATFKADENLLIISSDGTEITVSEGDKAEILEKLS